MLAEIITKDKWHSGCLIRELGAARCRNGCMICMLDVKMKQLEKAIPDLQEGGNYNVYDATTLIPTLYSLQKSVFKCQLGN